MKKNERVLIVEHPDTEAVVDFLGDDGFSVHVKREPDRLGDDHIFITVKVPHGPDAYSWELHEFTVPLTKREN